MQFADFSLILYPAILTIRLLIVCIGLLSFVGCGGTPMPVSSSSSPKDFGIALSPATVTAIAGGSQSTFAVSTTGQNGFANAVMVTLSGLPAGATASPASPFSVPAGASQTVTLSIPSTVSAGNFTLTASGTSAALTHSATLALTVDPGGDFSIATAPSTLTVTAGGSTSFALSITGQNGFANAVMVTLSGLPAGVTASPASPFSVPAGGSQTVTLSIPATVSAGNFTLTASGTSAALTHSASLTLTVDPVADFNIVLSPAALTVNAGASNSFTVSITGQGEFTGSVAVTLAGLPAGATTSPASPFTVAAGSSQPVVVSVPATVFAGNFPLTLSGASAALAHSVPLILTVLGQMQVATWHYDNERTSANLWETVLTPANVNSASFGKLFTQPVDGYIVGHPLYLPAVNIPGQGAHNVVYVATMHDSVYAFDADSASTPALWMTSIFTYSPLGATTVPATVAKNTGTTGWAELGIISTPVIDPATGTIYLVAETYENGKVVHRLHALDVTTGLEKFGGPTTITATYTLNGKTTTFTDLYQMNRPGLLLANSHIYIGFGSNSNNDFSQGWVLSYNASTLQQEGAYTSEPGKTLASIWQKGAGLSADSLGNIYAQTGEGPFTAGTNLSSSVLKLSQSGTTLALADWFTAYNQQYLSAHDLDLNDGVLILPDQPGPYPHELITGGKEGTIYVLNRDAMGNYCSTCTAGDTQIVQELPLVAHSTGIPVYWNNTVYLTPENQPISAYNLSNGTLVVPPAVQSVETDGGGHAMITANGNSNGVLWFVNGNSLWAMDAGTLNLLYTSNQAANGRDTVPPLAHFANPIAADGRVFIGTQNSLVVYGLLSGSAALGGSGHSYKVVSRSPLQAEVGGRGRQ
jgi:uncharacterized cupredoxin-like copper-binding protein